MTEEWTHNLAFPVYTVIFFAIFFCYARWSLKRKNKRTPFSENYKLLRGPGEGEQRAIQTAEENLFGEIWFAALVPLVIVWVFSMVIVDLNFEWSTIALILLLASFVISLCGSILWLMGRINNLRNHRLGYFGERLIAEVLEPLKSEGCRIFHDVPGSGFNIDHVVVAPTGIFAIETKTRRKPKDGSGDPIYVAEGKLVTPWKNGHDNFIQAKRQALWLEREMQNTFKMNIPVQAVLTYPYWYTKPYRGEVWVLFHDFIVNDILNCKSDGLRPSQIHIIASRLEQLCRDVEY